MSKFDELSELAVRCSEGFRRMRHDATHFSQKMVQRLANYLNATPERMYCREVDGHGTVIGERYPLPTLCFFGDGAFYFQLGFDFPNPKSPNPRSLAYRVEALYGVRQTQQGFAVVMPDGKEVPVSEAEIDDKFCQPVYESLKVLLARPWTAAEKAPIGFHVAAMNPGANG